MLKNSEIEINASLNGSDLSFPTAYTGVQSPSERFQHVSSCEKDINSDLAGLNNAMSSSPSNGGGHFITFAAIEHSEDMDAKSDEVDDLNASAVFGEESEFFREGVVSLETSLENEEDIDDFLDPFFDEDNSVENYFEFDIQQVILESIRDEFVPLNEYLDALPQKITSDEEIRQIMFQLKVGLSELAGIAFSPSASNSNREQYLVWKEVQKNISIGFTLFFEESEYPELLFSLVKSPSEFVHILPGLIKGLLSNHASDISDLIQLNLEFKPSDQVTILSLQEITSFFHFVHSYSCKDGLDISCDVSYDIQCSLLVILEAILRRLYQNIEHYISDPEILNSVFDVILVTVLDSFRVSLKFQSLSDFDRSFFSRLLPLIISVFSTQYMDDSSVSSMFSVVFLPFLKKLVVEVNDIVEKSPEISSILGEHVNSYMQNLVIACARLLNRLGSIGIFLEKTNQTSIDWTALARFCESTPISRYRELLAVNSRLQLQVLTSVELSVFDASLMQLVSAFKKDILNFSDNTAFRSDSRMTKIFSVLVTSIACSEFVVLLQSKNIESVTPPECRTDMRSKEIFALISSSLKGNGLEDMRELFYELYLCYLQSLSVEVKNVEDPDYYVNLVNCLLQTYETVALVIYYMIQDMSIDTKGEELSLYIGLLFGRVQSIASVGLCPFALSFNVSLEDTKNSTTLANTLLLSFNKMKLEIGHIFENLGNDRAMLNLLKIGNVFMTKESTELDKRTLIIFLLKSSIPILPIASSMANEILSLSSVSQFFDWLEILICNFSPRYLDILEETLKNNVILRNNEEETMIPVFAYIPELQLTVENRLIALDEKLLSICTAGNALVILRLLRNIVFLVSCYVQIENSLLLKLKIPFSCIRLLMSSLSCEQSISEYHCRLAVSGIEIVKTYHFIYRNTS